MTKVCHMTSAHEQEDLRIFTNEGVSLANAGYQVYEVSFGKSYKKNGVNIIGLGKKPNNRLKRMIIGAYSVYKKAKELDCNIYHFHDPELLPYGKKLKKQGKKVVFDSHENTVEQIKEKDWIPSFIRKPLYIFFDAYQKSVCRKLDAVISVTPHICEYFKKINPNTYMCTNYPILQPLHENRDRMARSVCFAGAISSQWNHDKIIRALEKLERCKYVLYGKGEGDYLNELKQMPGWNKVDYRGVLPHEEIMDILASCQVGLSILSYNNNTAFKTGTLGNSKIFEEMMAGLPVICTDFDLWKEFIERYNCGICVTPDSIDDISNAIEYLLDNPNEAKQMGYNGRKAIEMEFNWNMEERKLLELYKELAENEA